MTVQLAPSPVFRAVDNSGAALVGGKLFSYVAGTVTLQATYVDSTQTTQNTNPIILNARGEANGVWLVTSQTYKLVLEDANSNVIWTVDNIAGNSVGGTNVIIGSSSLTNALTINQAPSAFTALQLNVAPGAPGIAINDGTINGQFVTIGGALQIGTTSNHGLNLFTNNVARIRIRNDGALGFFGATPVLQTTGFGSPSGNAVIANFPGASATLVQCSNVIAELIVILEGLGLIGA
jgi:hypothetical protein